MRGKGIKKLLYLLLVFMFGCTVPFAFADSITSDSCPQGATYNPSTNTCDAPPGCTYGQYNSQTGQCEMQPVCLQGSLQGNQCVQPLDCPKGTFEQNGQCAINPQPICPNGYTLQNNECVMIVPPACPSGYNYVNGKCQQGSNTVPATCPSGYTLQNNQCIQQASPVYECPQDTTQSGNICYVNGTSCPLNMPFDNQLNACVTSPECPSGTTYNSQTNTCDSDPVCPAGYTFTNNTCQGALDLNSGLDQYYCSGESPCYICTSTNFNNTNNTQVCQPGKQQGASALSWLCPIQKIQCNIGCQYGQLNSQTGDCLAPKSECPAGSTFNFALGLCTTPSSCIYGSIVGDICEGPGYVNQTINYDGRGVLNPIALNHPLVGRVKAKAEGLIEYCYGDPYSCPTYDDTALLQRIVFIGSDQRVYSFMPSPQVSWRCLGSLNLTGLSYEQKGNSIIFNVPSGVKFTKISDVESMSGQCTSDNYFNITISIRSKWCPPGTIFHQSAGVCTSNPVCPPGFVYIGNGQCGSSAMCPPGYYYNSSLQMCEGTPNYTCPYGNSDACIQQGANYYCSPYSCTGVSQSTTQYPSGVTPGGTSPDEGNSGSVSNGVTYTKPVESSSCTLKDVRIFAGSDKRCRPPGFDDWFQNCCKKARHKILGIISFTCNSDEQKLAALRSWGDLNGADGQCHYIGEYCSHRIKTPFFKICLQHKKTYCCFASGLSRIIQEAAHQQLDISWGSPKSPNCSGLTIAQFQKIDFSKIDFSEWIQYEVDKNVKPKVSSSISSATQNMINNLYNSQ